MKVAIISYSLTGNNESLAASLASHYQAEHIRISEVTPRTTRTTILDLLFNRFPPIQFHFTEATAYDLIIFVGPIWGGKVASPLRTCFRQIASQIRDYAFVSISGGAIGHNRKLEEELVKYLKKGPRSVVDMHISDLLPVGRKHEPAKTSAYRLGKEDTRKLADAVIAEFDKSIA
jgi:hypothetical protein